MKIKISLLCHLGILFVYHINPIMHKVNKDHKVVSNLSEKIRNKPIILFKPIKLSQKLYKFDLHLHRPNNDYYIYKLNKICILIVLMNT